MSNREHDELEQLIKELAPTEAQREALLEEHRQLEKDLLRLADPPPPADFLQNVMAKVAAQPARVSRAEILTAASVVFVALAVAAWAFLARDGGVSGVGVLLAQLVVKARGLGVAFGSALEALWATAALPLAASLLVMLVGCLAALRRLVAAAPSEAKVVS